MKRCRKGDKDMDGFSPIRRTAAGPPPPFQHEERRPPKEGMLSPMKRQHPWQPPWVKKANHPSTAERFSSTIRISCRGRLQDPHAARNQDGGPGQLHPLV